VASCTELEGAGSEWVLFSLIPPSRGDSRGYITRRVGHSRFHLLVLECFPPPAGK